MRKNKGFTLIEMMIVILVIAVLALIVGLAVRNAGQRAKSARKAEDVRAINEGCWLFENDTGAAATVVGDLTQDPAGAPAGYNGPYLRGNPTDPFGGGDYVITDGTVTGPGDVATFLN
jgi:general secretion pathway protein G